MKASKITTENYFSNQVANSFLSNSQIKTFCGVPAFKGCSAKGMAILKGEYKVQPNKAMLIGSYVDAYFEGTLTQFKMDNPQIFKKDGTLYADFIQADEIIKVAEADELFMQFMSGQKQVILTGKIEGYNFTGKIDSLHEHSIVDLKVMRDMSRTWSDELNAKINFIDAWGYDEQLAIYQELEFQRTGVKKECYIASLTKETPINKEIIHVPNDILSEALDRVKLKAKHVSDIKLGIKEPERCEECDYCVSTKKLTKIKSYYQL